jgi:uncharacterized membrane protein YtjA (UPF0391 family)
MLFYAMAITTIALVVALFGVVGTIGVTASAAQILVGLFLVVIVLSLIAGIERR